MKNLLTLNYWFNIRGGELMPIAFKILIGFLLLLAILWLLSLLFNKYKKSIYNKTISKFSSFLFANFFIGLFILFFTYEAIPFLSMRFWFLLWAVGMIIWKVFILKDMLEIPKRKEEFEKTKEFKKYIP